MLKRLLLDIPPNLWNEYKAALSKMKGMQLDDAQAESYASIDMFNGLIRTINAVEKPKCGNCDEELCDSCGKCHDPQCYEREECEVQEVKNG